MNKRTNRHTYVLSCVMRNYQTDKRLLRVALVLCAAKVINPQPIKGNNIQIIYF